MMAPAFEYCVIGLSSEAARGERLNVAVAVFGRDGLDVRPARRLDKVRALAAGIDVEVLRTLLSNLIELDRIAREGGATSVQQRHRALVHIHPLVMSALGTFSAQRASDYEDRVSSILRAMVEPEPAPASIRRKRSRLLSQVKATFKNERVLARPNENLDSHRIIQQYTLGEGLVADFVLRNGAMHVVETVDVSGDGESVRKAISEIAVAALVLERARMTFTERKTKARLVYEASSALERIAQPSLEAAAHQGAELVNWASAVERHKFVHSLTMLAQPFERKGVPGTRFVGRA